MKILLDQAKVESREWIRPLIISIFKETIFLNISLKDKNLLSPRFTTITWRQFLEPLLDGRNSANKVNKESYLNSLEEPTK